MILNLAATRTKHTFTVETFNDMKEEWADDDDAGYRKVRFIWCN